MDGTRIRTLVAKEFLDLARNRTVLVPVSTFELLAAKVFGALLPTLAISLVGLGLYGAGIAALAAPGVARAMASLRTLLLIVLVAPASALVSLQAAILISSRVNDPRTA